MITVAGDPGRSRPPFDPKTPNVARVYGYLLGGKDNFDADRAEAERLASRYPLRRLAGENRAFLRCAVAWLAGAGGVRQFLDIGCGLPTTTSTHEAAQKIDPSCRVVYADHDPVVVAHAREMSSRGRLTAVKADLASPAELLAHPDVAEQIRPGEPAGVILGMVLHHFPAEQAEAVVAELVGGLPDGSWVVLSVLSADEKAGREFAADYRAAPLYNHLPAQVERFVTGLELLSPGLTDAGRWLPGQPAGPPRPHQGLRVLAAVGRKPGGAGP